MMKNISGTNINIDVEKWVNGIYLVSLIQHNQWIKTAKLVINN